MNSTFIFNTAWRDALVDYPPEVRLEVYEAAIDYARSGELGELKPLAQMAFSFIRREIDYSQGKYAARREKQSQATARRWAEQKSADEAAAETIAGPAPESSQRAPMARISPPTLQEVKTFFAEQNFTSSPEDFFYYYEKTGWIVGRSKTEIKNWRAAATQWNQRQPQFDQSKNGSNDTRQPSAEDFKSHISRMLSDD